ncbi:RHS repeat-associated core domain-containing protein [Streptomyces sp. NBC_00366]|uniref:RHS repeat-associated core domain-containing protein n=1 Tax=Streptomyces sp. NBC_00366 TaxID=2975727 RepID=UPI002E25692C
MAESAIMLENGKFVRRTEGVPGFQQVPTEVGAPRLISEGLTNVMVFVNGPYDADLVASSREHQVSEVEAAAFQEIINRPGMTSAQRYELLHRVFGDNPEVVKIGMRLFGPEVAHRIWGPGGLDQASRNDADQDVEGAQPSDVIQGSGAQGPGPVPYADASSTAEDSSGQGTASSPLEAPRKGGDPLLLATGQLWQRVTDLEVRGRGIHFAFTRTYVHRTSYRGPMGFSWDHCYNLWLREAQEIQPDGSYANVVYRSTGEAREDCFVQTTVVGASTVAPLSGIAEATFRGPRGFFDELAKSGGTYRLRMVNGVVITYNDELRVSEIADTSGNSLTFTYQDGLLVRVVDAVGKVFEFRNDARGRLVEILDQTGGRRLRYTYDDLGNLVQADLQAAPGTVTSTDYIYLGPDAPTGMEHNLTEVINAVGESTLAVVYGTDTDPWIFNRVVEQRSLDGYYGYEYGPAEFSVDPLPADLLNLPLAVTRVTYPNGHSVEHLFNGQGNVVQRNEWIAPSTLGSQAIELQAHYAYNTEGLLVHERRPDGASVFYDYEVDQYERLNGQGTALHAASTDRLSFGNLRRRAETARPGHGESRQLVTTWTYQPGGPFVDRQRGPYYADPAGAELPGQATPTIQYGYDAAHRLIKIDNGSVQTADGSSQVLPPYLFSYDAHGNVTDLRIGALRTHYDYFLDPLRSGFVRRRVEDADALARVTTYDADDLGRTTGLRDSLGAETRWRYNGYDLVEQVTLPAVGGTAPTVEFRYDKARRLTHCSETVIHGDGTPHPQGPLIHIYRYDPNGRLIEMTAGQAAGTGLRRHRVVYTPWGQPRRVIDATGTVSELDYDQRNLLRRVRFAVGTVDQSEQLLRCNRSGELELTIDALGHKTQIQRDGFGRVHRVVDRDGNHWVTDYDAQDRAVRRRLVGAAPGGGPAVTWAESRQVFDAAGRITRRVDVLFVPGDPAVAPRELIRSYFYDELSRIVEVRDGPGTTHHFAYDGLGRLVESRDADGNTVRTDFKDSVRQIHVIRAERELSSVPPRSEYFRTVVRLDDRGLAIEETDPIGNTVRRVYDSRNAVEEISLPDGRRATYVYDIFGQLLQQSLQGTGAIAATAASLREYDNAGRLIALVTPAGERTEWVYDGRSRVRSCSGPDGQRTFEYDVEGRLFVERTVSGLRILRTYSPEGLPLSRSIDASGYLSPVGAPGYVPLPVAPATYRHTPTGKLTHVEEDGHSIQFDYDSLERVVRETGSAGSLALGWDDGGRRTDLVFPDGRRIGYSYSQGGRLTSIRQLAPGTGYPGDPAAAPVRLLAEVDRTGERPRRLTVSGIVGATYSYDAARRLVGIDYGFGGAPVETVRTLHGAGGERLLEGDAARLRGFGYDSFGRLHRAVDHSAGSPVPLDVHPLSPAVDEPGTLTVKRQADISATAQGLLGTAGPALRSFEYVLDDAGNRLATINVPTAGGFADTVPYLPGPGNRYQAIDGLPAVYDRDGNLLSDGTRTFHYDVLGRLRQTVEGAATALLTYDPIGRLAGFTGGGSFSPCMWAGASLIEIGQGAARAQLVPGDRSNSTVHVAAGGHDFTALTDDVGSVIGWAGTGGSKLSGRLYDPYGRILTVAGAVPAPLGFAGYLMVPQTELYWLAARVYDARLGRFLQPDPLGFADGLNVYAFARNAPGTFVDLFGFQSSEIDWSTVGAEAGKTAAIGLLVVGGAAAAVSAGVVSAPFVLTVGALAMAGVAVNSFFKRSDDAFAAGQTDRVGSAALFALGDTVGASNIYEGATGQDGVTDRALGTQERSTRLGTGVGTALTVLFGSQASKAGGALGKPANPMSLYSVPSISRPTYYNPLVTGKYVSPEGIVWEGDVFRGGWRATTRSWRAANGNTDAFLRAWPEQFRANSAGGSYWHVRSHFADMPGRGGAHSYFDPSFREHMVLIGDTPWIAGKGGNVQIGKFTVGPDQVYPLRDVWKPRPGQAGTEAAYYSTFTFVEAPYPQIGTMGGNPSSAQIAGVPGQAPAAPPPGTALSNGYRVIVRDGGEVGLVKLVTMYPE